MLLNGINGMSDPETHSARAKQGGDRPFISKDSFPCVLHTMLDEVEKHGLANIVSWQPHGRCFVVHKRKEFIEHILPVYFRMSKFASFQRQLNLYAFQRITTGRDKGGYYHDYFLRGRSGLCTTIQRQQVKGEGPRKPATPETEPNFYLMDFMPTRCNDSDTTLTRLSTVMGQMPSNNVQPAMESGAVSLYHQPILLEPSSLQPQHHGMMHTGFGTARQYAVASLVPALDTDPLGHPRFMLPHPTALVPSPTAMNQMLPMLPLANLPSNNAWLSTLYPRTLQHVPPLHVGNTPLAAASLPHTANNDEQVHGSVSRILLDAYVTAFQSGIPEHSDDGALTTTGRNTSADDIFDDWLRAEASNTSPQQRRMHK